MQTMNDDFKNKLKKQILHNRTIAAIALFGRKKKADERINFVSLKSAIDKRLETPINDDIMEKFYGELQTLSGFFIDYNENVKKLCEIEFEQYKSTTYKVEHFEYAETMIVEKALKRFSEKVNSSTNNQPPAYREIKKMFDDCRYGNIKAKQIEKTMWWFFLLIPYIDKSWVIW